MGLTFIALKPDAVQRGLVSEIMGRFEKKGLKLRAIKILVPSRELAETHYAEHKGKPFFDDLVKYLCSGPVIALCYSGLDIIMTTRKMIGATKPATADNGTIRGDFAMETGRNLVHGSDSDASAQRELALWFKPEEIIDWESCKKSWVYEVKGDNRKDV